MKRNFLRKGKKIKTLILVLFFVTNFLLLIPSTNAFQEEIFSFARIWYDDTVGFNKNGIGILILAGTYTNATVQNPNFREIDYCLISFTKNPFYFGITFSEELEIIRDDEGNIIYQEPEDGYVYLRKVAVDNYLPNSIKKIACRINYSTITFQGVKWYRIYVPDFNKKYEWKKFVDPSHEKWYTWGSNESIEFSSKAMFIEQVKDDSGCLEYDFTHPSDNSGQIVAVNKSYLASKGISNPYFEWGEILPWKTIPYSENETHYFIEPEHFSTIGIHEVASGTTYTQTKYYDNPSSWIGTEGLSYSYDNNVTYGSKNDLKFKQEPMEDTWCEEENTWGYWAKWTEHISGDGTVTFSYTRSSEYASTGTYAMRIGVSTYGPSYHCHKYFYYQRTVNLTGISNIKFDFWSDAVGPYRFNGGNFYVNGDNLTAWSGFSGSVNADVSSYSGDCVIKVRWDYYSAGYPGYYSYADVDSFTLVGADYETYKEGWIESNNITQYQPWTFHHLEFDIDYERSIPSPYEISWFYVEEGGTKHEIEDIDSEFEIPVDCKGDYWRIRGEFDGTANESVVLDSYPSPPIRFKQWRGEKWLDSVTRTTGAASERNEFVATSSNNMSGRPLTLKIPLSTSVKGITEVWNRTSNSHSTEVFNINDVVNGTYYYDPSEQFVYVGIENLSNGDGLNWSVNCTYGGTFGVEPPTYLTVGDYFQCIGLIKDADGVPISGYIATTRILYETGTSAIPPVEYNCTNGNFFIIIATNSLIPGIYDWEISFYDTESGVTFKKGGGLYLSFPTPDGVYSDAVVFFKYYNTNVGLGLIDETFKIYINNVRNYFDDRYYGYTGETFDIEIRDYYNFTMCSGNYTINQTYQALNLGLTFHEYDFTNVNDEYFYASFLKEGADRWYEKVVSSNGQKSFMLPSGNYTIRVYNADNSTYLSWSDTVNRSKAHLIGTSSVSLIIQGQSVIIGNFLEIREDLDYYFTPDVESICRNIPYVWSSYQGEGIIEGFRLVCPYQAMTATTKNETADNNFISYPLVPTNGTAKNGTIRIINDRIYLAGSSISFVNISYDGDYANTSYIPSFIDPFGADVMINASADLTIIRETEFQQVKKFNWMAKEDTDFYTATVNFENALNTSLRHVYCIIEFANEDMEEKEIEPDYPTVKVFDVTNGKYMTSGLNFQAEATGITFYIPAIAASETRSFTCSHETKTPAEISADAIETVDYYNKESYEGKLYYHIYAQWVNPKSKSFVGNLYIKFNFSTYPYEIAQHSFAVYDNEKTRYLNGNEFVFLGSGLTISQDVMGTVAPNHARSFDAYFLFISEEEIEEGPLPTKAFLHRGVVQIPLIGWWVEAFHILVILCLFGIGYPLADYYDKKTERKRRNLYITTLSLIFLGVFIIAYIKGV